MTVQVFLLDVHPTATHQTNEQAEYYREKSGAGLAIRWVKAVSDTVKTLRQLPERGALCNFRSPNLAQVRRLPIRGFDRFLVFYKVDTNRKTVMILAVHHGARDLEPLLRPKEAHPGLKTS